jgi:hypothetical protein
MRPAKRSRCATIVAAATVSVVVVVGTTAAAPASAGRNHSSQNCKSVGAVCWTRVDGVAIPRVGPLPKGAPPIAGTITIDLAREFQHSRAVRAIPLGTDEGFFWCLYNRPKSCIGEDRGRPGEQSPDGNSTYQTLNWIADAPSNGNAVWATLWNLIPSSGNSYEMQVAGLYNEASGAIENDPQDQWCSQNWQNPGQDILAQCQQMGDYYQYQQSPQQQQEYDIYDTHTGADTHVDCNCEDEEIIEGSPVEWHSWGLWDIEDGDTNSVTLSPWYAKAMAAYARAHRKDLTKAG